MAKKKSIKCNFLMNALLTMSSFVFPLITFPYVSRVLGPEGIGKVSFATSIITYFLMIGQLGIPTYGIRACAQVRDSINELSKTVQEIFIINCLMTIFSYIFLSISIYAVPRLSSDKFLYFIVSCSIIFNTLGMEWAFKALEKYTYITIRSIVFKFIALVALFLFIHKPEDYYLYAALSIFASSASGLLNFFRIPKYVEFKRFPKYNFSIHIRSILVFFAMTCATTIYTNMDSIMLGFMTTDSNVGYYATAVKIKNILASIVSSLGVVILPRASYYVKQGMKNEFTAITKKSINFVLLIACPFVAYFLFFAKECIFYLAGNSYEKSIFPMQIIMPTLLFIGLTNIFGIQILVPLGKEKKVLQSEIIGAIVDFLFNLLLIPRYGIKGAAIGTLFAEFSVFIYQIYVLKNTLENIFKDIDYGKILTATIISIFFSCGVKNIQFSNFICLMVSSILFGNIYFISLTLMKEKLVMHFIKFMYQNSREQIERCKRLCSRKKK